MPKLKAAPGTYQNIKDGVSQLTPEQAKSVVLMSYYDQLATYHNWTEVELNARVDKAKTVKLEEQNQKLAAEAAKTVQRERSKQYSLDNPVLCKRIFSEGYFIVNQVIKKTEQYYVVKLEKKKGWKKVVLSIQQLGFKWSPTQIRWVFPSKTEAMQFVEQINCLSQQKTNPEKL